MMITIKEVSRMKKLFILLMVLFTSLLFTGCDQKIAVSDEDGNPMTYSQEDLGVSNLDGKEGFFVLNTDGSLSPVISDFTGYSTCQGESTPDRFLWFTENEYEIMKLIPVVGKNSKVVFVYNSDKKIPDRFTLEKYAFRGYTVGVHFYRDIDDSMYIETTDALLGTYAAASLEKVDDEKEYRIKKVNDSESLPLDNIDNNMELLLGLEKDRYYNFSFFKGTKYITFTTIADTQVFQSEKLIELSNPYEKTEDGYFVVNLPSNLEDGYYYICGLGMFRYDSSIS